jgi:hypothetical protein
MGVRAGFVEMERSRMRNPLLSSSILILRFILGGRVGRDEKR